MKRETGGVYSILDISDAFDTVPHVTIAPVLEHLGNPTSVAGYICKIYNGCTMANGCRNRVAQIELLKGVKQGDPVAFPA